jgi:hypothetical protein
MNRDETVARLRDLRGADPERSHVEADALLLDLIGDDEVRDAFEAVTRWYA